jgi:tetratricopeptide (TPR) repeat protein
MGINYQEIESNSVGYKEEYEMQSLDFEEFLWAKGYSETQIEDLYAHIAEQKPFSQLEMDVMFGHFLDYVLVGGMPAIVSDFYSIMGDLLHQKGRANEAFAAYDSCLQWKPDNIGCLNNYAYYLSELGTDLDRAEQMSHQTIMAEPRNGTYLDTYAWILFMQKRYSEARIYIDQAVLNDSARNSVILEHAGDIYALNDDMEKALDYWMKAQQLDPKNKVLNRKIKRKKYLKK